MFSWATKSCANKTSTELLGPGVVTAGSARLSRNSFELVRRNFFWLFSLYPFRERPTGGSDSSGYAILYSSGGKSAGVWGNVCNRGKPATAVECRCAVINSLSESKMPFNAFAGILVLVGKMHAPRTEAKAPYVFSVGFRQFKSLSNCPQRNILEDCDTRGSFSFCQSPSVKYSNGFSNVC